MKKYFCLQSNINDVIPLAQTCHIHSKEVLTKKSTLHSFVASKNTPEIDLFKGKAGSASVRQVVESLFTKSEFSPTLEQS